MTYASVINAFDIVCFEGNHFSQNNAEPYFMNESKYQRRAYPVY